MCTTTSAPERRDGRMSTGLASFACCYEEVNCKEPQRQGSKRGEEQNKQQGEEMTAGKKESKEGRRKREKIPGDQEKEKGTRGPAVRGGKDRAGT